MHTNLLCVIGDMKDMEFRNDKAVSPLLGIFLMVMVSILIAITVFTYCNSVAQDRLPITSMFDNQDIFNDEPYNPGNTPNDDPQDDDPPQDDYTYEDYNFITIDTVINLSNASIDYPYEINTNSEKYQFINYILDYPLREIHNEWGRAWQNENISWIEWESFLDNWYDPRSGIVITEILRLKPLI